MISKEREIELHKLIKNGCNKSKIELAESVNNLIFKYVNKLTNKIDKKYLFLCGKMGALQATEKFDPEKGRFTTFSYFYIQREILKSIWEESSSVKTSKATFFEKSFMIEMLKETEKLKIENFKISDSKTPEKLSEKEELKTELKKILNKKQFDFVVDVYFNGMTKQAASKKNKVGNAYVSEQNIFKKLRKNKKMESIFRTIK